MLKVCVCVCVSAFLCCFESWYWFYHLLSFSIFPWMLIDLMFTCSCKHQINESGDRQTGRPTASQPVIQTDRQTDSVRSSNPFFSSFFLRCAWSDSSALYLTILLLSGDFYQLGQISAVTSPVGDFWWVLWTTASKTINKLKPSPVGKDGNYQSVITLPKGQTLRRLQ